MTEKDEEVFKNLWDAHKANPVQTWDRNAAMKFFEAGMQRQQDLTRPTGVCSCVVDRPYFRSTFPIVRGVCTRCGRFARSESR